MYVRELTVKLTNDTNRVQLHHDSQRDKLGEVDPALAGFNFRNNGTFAAPRTSYLLLS
jgi:hypothetical protein